jgi:hypothetical protein
MTDEELAELEMWARDGYDAPREALALVAEVRRLREQLHLANIDAWNEAAENSELRAEVATLRAAAHQRYAIGAEPMSEDLNSGAPIIGNRLKLK